ncbi:hypothetical protein ACTMU2_24580 [Cupriavidus basilensis]
MNRLVGKGRLSSVEEVSLAGQLAEMIDSPDAAQRVLADLADHGNPQIRRITLNAIRRSHQVGAPGLPAVLLRRMAGHRSADPARRRLDRSGQQAGWGRAAAPRCAGWPARCGCRGMPTAPAPIRPTRH